MSETTRHRSALGATLAGITDRWGSGGGADPDDLRADGLTCLVTGANRGLGRGIADELGQRGATVWLACRSGQDEAVERARALGHDARGIALDLVDPASIAALVAHLVERGVRLDRLVLNAGVVPARSRLTAAGLDILFHVNFLANVQLVDALLAADRIGGEGTPRIILVGSDSHRSAGPVRLEEFGEPRPYGTAAVVAEYGYSKLLAHTWAVELGRRLAPAVEVHHVCPGAVDSDLAREAPSWARPLLGLVMKAFFQSPAKAARPLVWLALAPEVAGRTGVYLHLRREVDCGVEATIPHTGARLWDASHALIARLLTPERATEPPA
jgi:retinol dehydrogenase-13